MSYQSFDYRVEDGVGVITFTRPHTLNSLTLQVYADLTQATRDIAQDERVRALIITGQGSRGFCSAGDVHQIIGALQGKGQQEILRFTRMTGALTRGLYALGKPTIAAVNGMASGSGPSSPPLHRGHHRGGESGAHRPVFRGR